MGDQGEQIALKRPKKLLILGRERPRGLVPRRERLGEGLKRPGIL